MIDVFAGPGGLSEGFASLVGEDVKFEIALSVEKDSAAWRTLRLRHFFRQFPSDLRSWFLDSNVAGAANHETRLHRRDDLVKYLFVSAFGTAHGHSPKLNDFPLELLPKHENVHRARQSGGLFEDRFRVQVAHAPATTVTSHIAKDGHYFIHHDPGQCRSWTVREAARVQTFPDNYFFEGLRTQQYVQVGNAVPPLLARSIARRVATLLTQCVLSA